MKRYFLKMAGTAAVLALMANGSFAQEEKTETVTRHNDDVIIIKPKTDVTTKLTIEINGVDVKVNGKPLAEYKSDDVIISKRKQPAIKRDMEEMDAPADRIRDEDNRIITEDQALLEDNDPGRAQLRQMTLDAQRSRFRGGANVYGYGNSTKTFSIHGNKAFLGVGTEKTAEGNGVIVTSVSGGSAAEKAGLKEGDTITKINDIKINSAEELTRIIGKFKPEEKITITYTRNKKELKTTAALTKRKSEVFAMTAPDDQQFRSFNLDNNSNFNFSWAGKPKLGLKAQETEDGKGLKVLDVDDESPADKAGIKEGDIITSFDGTDVNNIDKLKELSKPAIEKGSFMVKLTRDGKPQELQVKIPKNLKTTSL